MAPLHFTIVCEFEGGTYVSQVQAIDAPHALVAWTDLLRREHPIETSSALIAEAVTEASDKLVPLDGLNGVWCWATTVDKGFILVNIIHSA